MVFVLLIRIGEIEGFWRNAKGSDKHVINIFHRFFLFFPSLLEFAFLHELMGERGKGADAAIAHEIRFAGILGLVGFGKGGLWKKTIFLDKVDEHIPLSSIGNGIV